MMTGKKNQDDIRELIEDSKLNLTEKVEEPKAVITINNERFGTLGNFSAVVGKAKARKTYFLSAIVAAYLSGEGVDGIIKCHKQKNKERVLYFDTEQSRFDTNKVAKRVISMANLTPDTSLVEFYILRPNSTENRLKIIEEVIKDSNNVGLVVIDGVRDLIKDINSADQATDNADKLLYWTGHFNIHLIVVLHLNKTDDNLRGHQGTEINNKAESIIKIAKDQGNKNTSTVSVLESRGREFEKFGFMIDSKDAVKAIELPKVEQKPGRPSIGPQTKNKLFHEDLLQKLFTDQPKGYNTTEFKSALRYNLSIIENNACGDNTARNYLEYYKGEGYIKVKQKGAQKVITVVNRKIGLKPVENNKGKINKKK